MEMPALHVFLVDRQGYSEMRITHCQAQAHAV